MRPANFRRSQLSFRPPIATILSGVKNQSKNRAKSPFDSAAVDSGTLRIASTIRPDDTATNGAGRRSDKPFANENNSPQTSADTGAQTGPTEAMPSVANSEPLKFPT